MSSWQTAASSSPNNEGGEQPSKRLIEDAAKLGRSNVLVEI